MDNNQKKLFLVIKDSQALHLHRRCGAQEHTKHEVFVGYKEILQRGKSVGEQISKLDREVSGYEVVFGKNTMLGRAGIRHVPVPGVGHVLDFVVKHSKVTLAIGLFFSAVNIYNAYTEDAAKGQGFQNTIRVAAKEVGGWGGAIVGCEGGAIVGSIVPGVGTVVGCFARGVLGASAENI